jgi:uncharacterized protein
MSPITGVALGWRPELASDLLRAPGCVDFVEVVADTCFSQPAAWREARAIAELMPVVPHGVKLSLGSAAGIEPARLDKLGRLARELRAPAITEHVAFTRAGGCEIGHLTPLPFTRAAIRVLARNVATARRKLPDVPLLLENVAWTLRWPEDELPEAAFYTEIAEATGCDLLLDVANLYANALNAGVAPLAALRDYPLDRVGMLHVAGGAWEHDFFLDTHAHPTSEDVFALVAAVLARRGPIPIVLERDQGFPPFQELLGEVERLRALQARAPVPPGAARVERRAAAPEALRSETEGLQARQVLLAMQLTSQASPAEAGPAPFDPHAIARTRAVLSNKRVDEALPLLPNVAAAGEPARTLATCIVRATPRAPRRGAIVDALRIVEAALAEPDLADAARRDRLELRSRFTWDARSADCAPRRGVFLGREPLPRGGSVWALKGLGTEAPVRLIERGGWR